VIVLGREKPQTVVTFPECPKIPSNIKKLNITTELTNVSKPLKNSNYKEDLNSTPMENPERIVAALLPIVFVATNRLD